MSVNVFGPADEEITVTCQAHHKPGSGIIAEAQEIANVSAKAMAESPDLQFHSDNWRMMGQDFTTLITSLWAKICLVFVVEDDHHQEPEVQQNKQAEFKRVCWRLSWWQRMLNLFCLYITLWIIIYVVLQNIHDFHLFQLKTLARRASLRLINMTELINSGVNMRRQVVRDRARLKAMGAPYMHFSFAIQCALTFVAVAYCVSYLQPFIYFRLVRPKALATLRNLLEWRSERLNYNRLMAIELHRFIVSGRNLIKIQLGLASPALACSSASHSSPFRTSANFRPRTYTDLSHLRHFRSGLKLQRGPHRLDPGNYERLLGELRARAARGALLPLNRSTRIMAIRRWLAERGITVYVAATWSVLAVSLTPYLGYSYRTLDGDLSRIENDPKDTCMALMILAFCVLNVVCTGFYSLMLCLSTFDQVVSVLELSRRVNLCILTNDRMIFELSQWPAAPTEQDLLQTDLALVTQHQPKQALHGKSRDEWRCRINTNLLLVLLHFKMLIAQSRTDKDCRRFLALIVLELWLPIMLLARLYAQFFEFQTKMFLVAIMLVVLVWADFNLLPICYLYCRQGDLYKSLFSLLAHAVQVSLAESKLDARRTYHTHTLLLLKKELSHSELLVNQIAVKPLGITLTYPNCLRIHFWFGLLLITILHAEYDISSAARASSFFGEGISFL